MREVCRTDDIVLPAPDVDVNGVEDAKEREAPGDGVDDHALSGREELVDDCAEKEQMNERPVETQSVSQSVTRTLLNSKRV